MFDRDGKRMYHHDFINVSHAHVGRIPEDNPHYHVTTGGVTRRFKEKRGLY